ncbi:hypothetical protein LWI28_014882 [Acer negundo]|uniref:Uncharacterized protein n=1 Tax=Acer negundo TaxID=4023 RepID=A0AAD5NLR9_ACENE|nr:hypothetical protein LWI28_014882 [Acer negundo]
MDARGVQDDRVIQGEHEVQDEQEADDFSFIEVLDTGVDGIFKDEDLEELSYCDWEDQDEEIEDNFESVEEKDRKKEIEELKELPTTLKYMYLGENEAYPIIVALDLKNDEEEQLIKLGMASALETLCGQAFGAKKYYMLGVYMQLSRIVLSVCCILLLPLYLFASPVLKVLGQTKELSELSGLLAMWMIPLHFSLAFQMQLGVVVTAATLNISWWVLVFGLYGYVICGGCPLTWTGFSMEAFSGLWEFVKLSAASGVRLCLENWYYKILILMTGNLKNAEIAVDALSIGMCDLSYS